MYPVRQHLFTAMALMMLGLSLSTRGLPLESSDPYNGVWKSFEVNFATANSPATKENIKQDFVKAYSTPFYLFIPGRLVWGDKTATGSAI